MRSHDPAAVRSNSFDHPGGEGNVPVARGVVRRPGFRTERLSVEKQFDSLAVTVDFHILVVGLDGVWRPIRKQHLLLTPLRIRLVTGVGRRQRRWSYAPRNENHRLVAPPALSLETERPNSTGAIDQP